MRPANSSWGLPGRGWAACLLLIVASCQAPATTDHAPQDASTKPQPPARATTAVEPPDVPGVIGAEEDDADGWLFVRQPTDRAAGAWATGSFDRSRNRMTIRTHGVRSFVVDTTRIRIDWDSLVVLSIDGRTSELRRRDDPLLEFEFNESGEWIIREP